MHFVVDFGRLSFQELQEAATCFEAPAIVDVLNSLATEALKRGPKKPYKRHLQSSWTTILNEVRKTYSIIRIGAGKNSNWCEGTLLDTEDAKLYETFCDCLQLYTHWNELEKEKIDKTEFELSFNYEGRTWRIKCIVDSDGSINSSIQHPERSPTLPTPTYQNLFEFLGNQVRAVRGVSSVPQPKAKQSQKVMTYPEPAYLDMVAKWIIPFILRANHAPSAWQLACTRFLESSWV